MNIAGGHATFNPLLETQTCKVRACLEFDIAVITVTPTANAKEWTFTMPAYNVEVGVEYETELALSEADDNTATLAEWDGYEADITLTRTLTAGMWITLAVPFSISTANYAALQTMLTAQGGSIMVKQLSSSELNDNTLTLNFADATSIEAGKPYLVKVSNNLNLATLPAAITAYAVANPGIANPFAGVEISKTAVTVETTAVDFIPTLGLTTPAASASNILFLGANNTLLNPSADGQSIKGFRAYFQLKGEAAAARSFVLDFGDGEASGIQTLDNLTISPVDNSVYDLSGRKWSNSKLSNGQMPKGVYIVNGRKVVVR